MEKSFELLPHKAATLPNQKPVEVRAGVASFSLPQNQ